MSLTKPLAFGAATAPEPADDDEDRYSPDAMAGNLVKKAERIPDEGTNEEPRVQPTPARPRPAPAQRASAPRAIPKPAPRRAPSTDAEFVLGELRAPAPYMRVTIGVPPDTKVLLDRVRADRRWSSTDAVLGALGQWLANDQPDDNSVHDVGRIMVQLHVAEVELNEIDRLARDAGLSRSSLIATALHTGRLTRAS